MTIHLTHSATRRTIKGEFLISGTVADLLHVADQIASALKNAQNADASFAVIVRPPPPAPPVASLLIRERAWDS